ncbi:hypothetical protein [Geothrix sp. PMB-07]|uniref:hypothetical protein n=1 Tax=Geothrix sp. PMB-07 TaxID=3068640 RepID=UPI0027423B96|nr:hypothetical protein [Geothrix sp. PMB-07]WLT31103.1 hypothetical protein Q9293_15400 [Geothrix sp. PMB-07]
MASTLRDLLIQRAARLQSQAALSTPDWGTLSYAQLRNRVEGVALGLLSREVPSASFSSTHTPWDWAAELAVAASGLVWDPAGQTMPSDTFGGARFNHEDGRGPYHAREQVVQATTPFSAGLDQGELMLRLRRLNTKLGWDHTSRIDLPLARLGEAPLRAALWSALYAGAHAVLIAETPTTAKRFFTRFQSAPQAWDAEPFLGFWNA